MRWLWLLLLWPSLAGAQITAASCNQSDVQTAFNSVTSSTTTVTIPSGTCAWTSPASLTLPNSGSLTIQGSTSITGNCSPSSQGCSATDSTIIVDNYASTNALMVLTTNTGCSLTRITGITFKGGTGSVKQNGELAVNGNCHSVRVDHNHFFLSTSTLANIGVRYSGWVYGVMDHNLCDMTTTSTSECENVWTDAYGGDAMGHGAWADVSGLGGANFMFVENNVVNNGLYFNDCDFGGRSVVRYNVLNQAELQTHPTGSSPDADRGCRAQEIYQNVFNGNSACNGSSGFNSCLYNGYFLSSGTGVIWGNNMPNISGGSYSGYQWLISIQSMRINNSTYGQTATPNGWGYCGSSSGLSGDNSAWDGSTGSGYPCLDQPGRGKGQLLSGDFPSVINTATSSIAWPNEALEPIYEWLDVQTPIPNNPSGIITNSSPSVLSANKDYYLYTSSFTGATGTGSGTLAARPSSCTSLTAYWATDTLTLYQCATTNTWTTYYSPYTYPHPLVSSTTSAATPTFAPVAGTYTGTQSVVLSTAAGSIICYNTAGSPATNGTIGCTTGTKYTGAITVASSETLYAVAGGTGYTDSAVGSAAYTIKTQAAVPTFSPVAGTYIGTQTVTISRTTGSVTCYNTTGAPATNQTTGCASGSTLYTGSISVTSTSTIYAVAGGTGYTDSSVGSAGYTINPAVLSPPTKFTGHPIAVTGPTVIH